jgi:hypothetical protein
MIESYTDWLGNVIVPGDHVIYPGRQSSSLWMNHAKVLSIGETESYWGGTSPILRVQHTGKGHHFWNTDKVVTLSALNRVTKV